MKNLTKQVLIISKYERFEALKSKATNAIYSDLEKIADIELEGQILPKAKLMESIKNKLDLMIDEEIEEMLEIILKKRNERTKMVKDLIEEVVTYF